MTSVQLKILYTATIINSAGRDISFMAPAAVYGSSNLIFQNPAAKVWTGIPLSTELNEGALCQSTGIT